MDANTDPAHVATPPAHPHDRLGGPAAATAPEPADGLALNTITPDQFARWWLAPVARRRHFKAAVDSLYNGHWSDQS